MRFSIEEGWRSGTKHHNTETDIVVTVAGIVVVTIEGARIVLIVDPRAAPQVRRSEPPQLCGKLPRHLNFSL